MNIQSPALDHLSPKAISSLHRGQFKKAALPGLVPLPPSSSNARMKSAVPARERVALSVTDLQSPKLTQTRERPEATATRPPTMPPLPPQTEPLTLDGLMKAWGQSDSPYDLTGDGTVNVNDLLEFINNWEKYNSPPASNSPGNPEPSIACCEPSDQPHVAASVEVSTRPAATANVRGVTDSLFDHLSVSGFAQQPPVNIRELVDAISHSPRQADMMLKQLSEKYPDGLGVNMVA